MSLDELNAAGLLNSSPEQLRSFGFERCYISDVPASELALRAAKKLMEQTKAEPESIDLLLYAGAFAESQGQSFLSHFNYPVAKMQYELGLINASAFGINQAGCMGLTQAITTGLDFLGANAYAKRVLCVSADVLPQGESREILYNVISDGACAVLVERECPRNRMKAHRAITKGYYWDCIARKNEIMAAYFPTAKYLIEHLLFVAQCSIDQLQLVVPHNVSLRSWEILLGLTGIKREKLFTQNIAGRGHVIAGDNWMNLKDSIDLNLLNPGDKLLLFNFGFGANWSATLIEH